MKSTKRWILLIAAFLAVCAATSIYIFTSADNGNAVIVTRNGIELYCLDLSVDTEITVHDEDGGYNIIVVEAGAVKVSEADCPDQICVKQGAIDDDAVPIVCLPHKLVIEVTAESDADAVVK